MSLRASGTITETAGSGILANTVSGGSGGGTTLGGNANQIAILSGFTAGGDFTLRDSGPNAPVEGAQVLTVGSLQIPVTNVVEVQDLAVTGPVQANGTLSLTTLNGNITIDGGSLSATTVALSAGSNSTGLTQLPQSSVVVDKQTSFNSNNPATQLMFDGELPNFTNDAKTTTSSSAVLVTFPVATTKTTSTVVVSDVVTPSAMPNPPGDPVQYPDETKKSTISTTVSVNPPSPAPPPLAGPAQSGPMVPLPPRPTAPGSL